MGRFYENSQLADPKKIIDEAPMDDREVVSKQNDLFLASTWQNRGLYSGLLVRVIRDGSNNGLYLLTHKNYYNKQLWDSSKSNFGNSGHGWMRIGVIVLDTNPADTQDPPGSFGGSGTNDDPYYVSTIEGGTFNDENN